MVDPLHDEEEHDASGTDGINVSKMTNTETQRGKQQMDETQNTTRQKPPPSVV